MNELEQTLAGFGVWLLAKQLGQDLRRAGTFDFDEIRAACPDEATKIDLVREVLRDESLREDYQGPKRPELRSIFTLVPAPLEGEVTADIRPVRRLSLNWGDAHDEWQTYWQRATGEEPQTLWHDFGEELARLSPETSFETFYHLFAHFAWFVVGALEDPMARGYGGAVSVFEQWKATVALVYCIEDKSVDQEVLLVGGDLPGIQDMLYTITSKGAAKSLRSRSLYLQLVNDAVIRAILRELKLPWANVVYSAGGNFKLLAPLDAESTLDQLRDEINSRLLDLHRGELFAALTWVRLRADKVTDRGLPDEPDSAAEMQRELGRQLEAEKNRPFARLTKSRQRYLDLFGTLGSGGPTFSEPASGRRNFCQVCQTEVNAQTWEIEPDPEGGEPTTYCKQCASFGYERLPHQPTLARQLIEHRLLVVENCYDSLFDVPPIYDADRHDGQMGNLPWDEGLRSLGFDYRFEDEPLSDIRGGLVYSLDQTKFNGDTEPNDPHVGYGFRLVARLTPRDADEQRNIRDTHVMAKEDSTGLHRYGVLRMDVDSLGQVLVGGLRFPDIVHSSALSAALSLFFEGYLDSLCKATAAAWRGSAAELTGRDVKTGYDVKVPYVIYAGGDDLFIVGPWDVLPEVARQLQQALAVYTGGHLTLSGGISLGTEKFPLYQAADLALNALDDAKEREVQERGRVTAEKNALNFLGMTVGWEEWQNVADLAHELAQLVSAGENGVKAPRSLLSALAAVARMYQKAADEAGILPTSRDVALGEWVWALHYGLRRASERVKREPGLQKRILGLAGSALDLADLEAPRRWQTVRHLGLPVRWAEFLSRKENS